MILRIGSGKLKVCIGLLQSRPFTSKATGIDAGCMLSGVLRRSPDAAARAYAMDWTPTTRARDVGCGRFDGRPWRAEACARGAYNLAAADRRSLLSARLAG